jgi:hypothetical protein
MDGYLGRIVVGVLYEINALAGQESPAVADSMDNPLIGKRLVEAGTRFAAFWSSFIGPIELKTAAGRRTGKPARARLSARGSIGEGRRRKRGSVEKQTWIWVRKEEEREQAEDQRS